MDEHRSNGEAAGEPIEISERVIRQPSFPRLRRQSPLQRVFLHRLERLAMLERYGQQHLAFSNQETVLLKKAVYSTYRDCADLGLQREARAILAED